MIVDERRHHGLAGDIDARCAGRHRHLAAAAHRRDPVARDDDGGIVDRRTAIAGDEPRAFEYGNGRSLAAHR
jgi:hypothetical protein